MSSDGITNVELLGCVLDQHTELEEQHLRIVQLEDQVTRLSTVAQTEEHAVLSQDAPRPNSEPATG